MSSLTPRHPTKPQFWRVRNIGNNESESAEKWLHDQVKESDVSEGAGYSLAADSEGTLCATVTSRERPLPRERSWRVDNDFVGFTPLCDPKDARVDIVAVTGLGGHALGSFRSTGGATVWLRDFAPRDVPQARFITYGYDTAVVASDSNQGIHELAHTLLDGLAIFRRRTGAQKRPLLFVCHSLGGVVLKEALVLSSKQAVPERSDLHDIVATTHGLVLLGVPNLGLRHTQLQVVVKAQPNEGFVRDLQVQPDGEASQFLSSLTREFSALDERRRPPFEIISYYETMSSPTVAFLDGRFTTSGPKEFMVTKTSAERIGSLARDIEHLPSHADHRGLVRFEHSQDGRYVSLIEKLKSMAAKAQQTVVPLARCSYTRNEVQSVKRHKLLPFPRNRKFVGRTQEIDSLEQRLFIDQDCQKIAVVGLGGIGKTQVVLEFTHAILKKHADLSVFWVPALSAEVFEKAYAEIAKLLNISGAIGIEEDMRVLVREYLSSNEAGRWLMIVDNADDIDLLEGTQRAEGISKYLPDSDLGATVFTTRDRHLAHLIAGSDVIELGRMPHQEAVDVLKHNLVCKSMLGDEDLTTLLLVELDDLPLVMTQAAAYMNCNTTSLKEYLELIRSTEQDLVYVMSLEMRDHTRYKQASSAVAKTWLVSFDQMAQRDADAAYLLRYMSCFQWKAIPRSILPPMEPAARMRTALGTLCAYSFVAPRSDGDEYDMHRLVHVAARLWAREKGVMTEVQRKAILYFTDVFPSNDISNRETWRQYIPHAARVKEIDGEGLDEVKGELCLSVVQCLEVDGKIRDAVSWMEQSLRLRLHLAQDHPSLLISQHALASAYKSDGQIGKAVKLLEHVVAIQEHSLAETHPDQLTSQHALAGAYEADGQIGKAVKLLEHVVSVEEHLLAEDHPDRLASQHALAGAYKDATVMRLVASSVHTVPSQHRRSDVSSNIKPLQSRNDEGDPSGSDRKWWRKWTKRRKSR